MRKLAIDAIRSFPKAAGRDRRDRLRIVRHLLVRAELSKPGEAWGQLLDAPSGRKPRGRADEDQQRRGTMGIGTSAIASEAAIVGLRGRYVSVGSQGRSGNVNSRVDCSADNRTFCSTRPWAFATASLGQKP